MNVNSIVLFCSLLLCADAHNILFLPRDVSHSRAMTPYAEQLALRGHKVKIWTFGGGNSAVIPALNVSYHVEPVNLAQLTRHRGFSRFADVLEQIHPALRADDFILPLNESMFTCPRFIGWRQSDLMKLKAENWDLIVADEIPPNICVRAITRKLNVSYVIWNTMIPAALWHEGVDMPQAPSYYPSFLFKEKGLSRYQQRLSNCLYHLLTISLNKLTSVLTYYFQPRLYQLYTADKFASNSLLTFTQWPAELDFISPQSHRLVMSNLMCPKTKKLDRSWEEFLDTPGSNGTILLSLGHLLWWDAELLRGFFAVAEKLDRFNFVWHLKVPQSLPHFRLANVKISTWLPLDDLLSHPKTVAFVSHVGAKSLLGSFCTSTPIVAVPHRFDQYRSAAKVSASGIGVTLDRLSSPDELIEETLVDVIVNPKYRDQLIRLRTLAVDRLMPSEGIIPFQIERSLRRNVTLLHSSGGKLHLVLYYSLDLLAVPLGFAVVAYVILNLE